MNRITRTEFITHQQSYNANSTILLLLHTYAAILMYDAGLIFGFETRI